MQDVAILFIKYFTLRISITIEYYENLEILITEEDSARKVCSSSYCNELRSIQLIRGIVFNG